MHGQNIISAIYDTIKLLGDGCCATFKKGDNWQTLSWNDLGDRITQLACALRRQGIKVGDRVVIFADTSVEWTIADCAILACGAIVVPIYPTLNTEKITHILEDSEPAFAFVKDANSASKFAKAYTATSLKDIPVWTFDGFAEYLSHRASELELGQLKESIDSIGLSQVATIVYTSGTTGEQKGAQLTHENLKAEIEGVEQVFDFTTEEVGILCLPLAHVLGRMMQFYQLTKGCQTAYAESVEKLAQNYLETRPHFVCAVPRMLEKIYELTQVYIRNKPRLLRKATNWAIRVGLNYEARVRKFRPVSAFLRFEYFFANVFFFSRIRNRLGGRIRSFICGGAPLKEELCKFFHAAGILVLEGYGLTETFAAVTVNRPDDFHFGTVGKPIPNTWVKLSSDGEVLVKGPIVFKGYHNLKSETEKVFTDDGWFKTGDLGEYSRDGFLRITGRKKEIIVTAGGKNIAPQMIENLMATTPFINQFMVYGDSRKFLTALVTINEAFTKKHLTEKGVTLRQGEKLHKHPLVIEMVKDHIDEKNTHLASFETVKRFAIIDGSFSMETGELTPTLKLKRKYVGEKYRALIDSLYEE